MLRKILKILILLAISTVFVMGCAGNMPSVCDDVASGESALCDMASKYGVRLEDVGNGFIIANGIAIGNGYYTREDAKHVVSIFRTMVSENATYAILASGMLYSLQKYPGLFEISTIYLSELLSNNTIISSRDKKILNAWFDNVLAMLG